LSYDIYVAETSSNPSDDESSTWQTNATHIGTYTSKTESIILSDSFSFEPDKKYTIKIKPSNGDIGFQANLQTTHFHEEIEL